MKEIPYIDFHINENGLLILKIEDTELFNYLEDYLIEECGISPYSYLETEVLSGKSIYKITFHNETEFDSIIKNLSKLDPKDIIQIYDLNN